MRDLETVDRAHDRRDGHFDVWHAPHELGGPDDHRIIDIFPANQQSKIRTQLSLVSKASSVSAAARADGKGRVVSLEIMVPTPAIRNLIRDDKVHQNLRIDAGGQDEARMQTANTVARQASIRSA